MPWENEAEYIERLRKGDKSAFESLIALYLKKSFGIALRFMGNAIDAEEMIQESCIKAYRNLDQFDSDNPFGPWFYRILTNTCLNQIKRRKIRRFFNIGHQEDIFIEGRDLETSDIEGPEARVIRNEQSELIHRALSKIPEKQRAALILFDIEGLTQQEVSNILDCPVGSVMSRVFYGRKRLKKLLQPYFK